MYKNIMVPFDDSKTAHSALSEAIKIAKINHSKIRIINVVDQLIFSWVGIPIDIREIQATYKKEQREILEKAAAIVKQQDIEVETHLIELFTESHRIADKIIEEADQWPADLIVIGTHGRRGVGRLLLGSVAEGVVRLTNKPVLLIRGKEK